jgi:steroid 5-alpha reductase family enzyme
MLQTIFTAWLGVILLMCGVWLLFLWQKNAAIIDVFWSIAITTAAALLSAHGQHNTTVTLLKVLLFVWMLRLAGYLFIHRVLAGHVDPRYDKISQTWRIPKSLGFFLNFQFQGILATVIASPFLFIAQLPAFSLWASIGLAAILSGIAGETIADWQLQRFKKQRRGPVCNQGLWRYSRHPNYFFDWLTWLGFAVAACAVPRGWLSLLSPMLLYWIMTRLTGPITERGSIESRGQVYLDYQAKTSMFFPWRRKKA